MKNISKMPWQLHDGGTSVIDADGDIVASCGFIPYKSILESKANAALISEIPLIIEALIECIDSIDAKNNGDYSGNIPTLSYKLLLKRLVGKNFE